MTGVSMEWWAHCKKYLCFSPREKKQLIISAVVFGFILSFRMWGGDSFNATSGMINWLLVSFVVLFAMFLNFFIQKVFAIKKGFLLHFFWWFPGILIGVFLTIISFGIIPFLFPGTVYLEHLKGLRLGHFRYGTNTKDLAEVSVAGVIANVAVALLFSFIYLATNSEWVFIFVKVNFAYAFFSMLPIPTISGLKLREGATPGFNIFFFSRRLYIFIFFSLTAFSLLIYYGITVLNSFWSLILALFLGLIGLLIFVKIFGTR
ncbi:MAG: hypothetical protein KKA51_00795 [Nanoarchaeota archaeon]|nr:hypothetical protein [Nanoarchaeota archaeon]MBU2442670.1 hypothetical protein [Nanoarchaeota archaeon]